MIYVVLNIFQINRISHKMRLEDRIERLRSNSMDKRVEAAIDISTFNLSREIGDYQARKLAPPLKQMLRTGESYEKGTAASALARLAYEHPDPVRDATDDFADLLYDDTRYQEYYYNASNAILALAALGNENSISPIQQSLGWYRE